MQELGQYLREEREKRNLSLEAISRDTRVSMGMLRALEEGDYSSIGSPILIRGFIRSYCNVLGIDGNEVLEEHGDEISGHDYQEEGIQRYQVWASQTRPGRRRRSAVGLLLCVAVLLAVGWIGWKWYEGKNRQNSSPLPSVSTDIYPEPQLESEGETTREAPIWTARTNTDGGGETPSGSGFTGGSEDGLARLEEEPLPGPEGGIPQLPAMSVEGSSLEEPQQTPATDAAGDAVSSTEAERPVETTAPEPPAAAGEVLPAPAPIESSAGEPEDVPQPAAVYEPRQEAGEEPGPLPAGVHRLTLKASAECWVAASYEGKRVAEALMGPGDQEVWEVKEGTRLVIGNAGGVELTWDTRPLGELGASGQVLRVKLPPSSTMFRD